MGAMDEVVTLAAVMTEGGAELVVGAADVSVIPSAEVVTEADEALAAVREFFAEFCEWTGFAMSAKQERLIRQGMQVQLLDEAVEQVSRDLGEKGTERCALVTSFSDGGSSDDSEGCVAVYEMTGGGWLLVEYSVPEFCDDESDAYLSGITLFPSSARDELMAELTDAAVDACAHLMTRAGYIAKAANRSGLVGDDLLKKLKQKMTKALKEAA